MSDSFSDKAGTLTADKVAPEAIVSGCAGGVVFRGQGDSIENLLVEVSDDLRWLVLPKARVEEGAQDRETAIREVHRETGVCAHPEAELGCVPWQVKGKTVTTRIFLMRAIGKGRPQDKGRPNRRLTLDAARKIAFEEGGDGPDRAGLAIHNETLGLLKRARKRMVFAGERP